MSSQKGNCSRTRSQKHKNTTKFKNNLHDTSKRTKVINTIRIEKVCERCKAILEWKIKYKKYKMLKNQSTCCKCHNKCIKEAYHTICEQCSKNLKVCPKCGNPHESLPVTDSTNQSNGCLLVGEIDKDNCDYNDNSDFDEGVSD